MPRTPDFLIDSEVGLYMADELWRYCRSVGQTPAQAYEDPELPFNLTVMRASRAFRRLKWGLMHSQVGDKDEFGSNHNMNTLSWLYEDL